VSILPNVFGFSGPTYFVGALILGLVFLGYCVGFSREHSARAARRLLLASVVYLPVVLLLMVADQALLD
jgi:protoheme IX farnesyltransferase